MARGNRYRGRRGVARVLGILGVIVLIVAVLVGAVYFFLRDNIHITEDGLVITLPFLKPPSPSPSASLSPGPGDDVTLIIESPSPSRTPAPPPPASPSPSSPDLSKMVVVELKTVDGVLAPSDALPATATSLEDGAFAVGYICVLKDNVETRKEEMFGLKHVTAGVNWLDANRDRWLNVINPEVRDWLAVLVGEYSKLPVDSLILDYLSYDFSGGHTDKIKWDEPSYGPALNALWVALRDASGVPVWAVVRDIKPTGFELYLDGDLNVYGS
ncbi:hypothetical protein FACS1894208_02720 [Clostridia bacterium]|nr:hypothetical protein FACS1894208_02720 [Clostridia bacterium]